MRLIQEDSSRISDSHYLKQTAENYYVFGNSLAFRTLACRPDNEDKIRGIV